MTSVYHRLFHGDRKRPFRVKVGQGIVYKNWNESFIAKKDKRRGEREDKLDLFLFTTFFVFFSFLF